jgi:hypothetical protein
MKVSVNVYNCESGITQSYSVSGDKPESALKDVCEFFNHQYRFNPALLSLFSLELTLANDKFVTEKTTVIYTTPSLSGAYRLHIVISE